MLDRINELIENKDYKKLKKELIELNVADIAEIIEDIEDETEQVRVFRLLPKSMAADIFANISIDVQQEIITSLSTKEAGSIIDNLDADDAVDLIEEMPASIVTKLLANTTAETRKDINYLLKYPENSAGSIMNIDFLDLKEDYTVSEAIDRIRKEGKEKETINVCFILDKSRKLVGTIELKNLLFNPANKEIKEFMDDKVVSVYTSDDQEEVANTFKKYDMNIMPVVDSENRLVGIITIDDVVDVLEEEATEDMKKMAAIIPVDKPYDKISVFEIFKSRIPWLLLLMISATFTGGIISSFESKLASCAALTAFIPMLMDTGGNAGGQSSVSIIRALSLGQIEFSDIIRVVWKEIRVAFLCSIVLAFANFGKLLVIDRVSVPIAAAVCITLCITVLIAKFIGCTLPMITKKLGFDPAVMASPFITTIVDAISLFAYFQIATLILKL